MARRALQKVSHHAGVLAAHRERHDAAQQDQKPAGGRTDIRAGGQEGCGQHGASDQGHGQQQHAPPSMAVADVPERDRTERAHEIGEGEAAERGQWRGVAMLEENPRQHRDHV